MNVDADRNSGGGVMIAVDRRPGSVAVARWGVAVAALSGVTVELVQVLRNTAELLPSNEAWYIRQSTEELKAWAERHHLGECALHVIVADPGEGLVRRAADTRPSMVVIGAHVRTQTDRDRSAMAQYLARRLVQPVVVVPSEQINVAGRPVVAGIESVDDGIVLEWAQRFASHTGGSVLAVSSNSDIHDGPPELDATNERTHDAEDGLHQSPVRFVARVDTNAAEALSSEAVLAGASLIVIAAKTRHSLAGILLGSTAARLIDDPPVPVAVLPRVMLTS